MKVEFGAMEETAIPGFKGGEGVTHARMFADGRNRIMGAAGAGVLHRPAHP